MSLYVVSQASWLLSLLMLGVGFAIMGISFVTPTKLGTVTLVRLRTRMFDTGRILILMGFAVAFLSSQAMSYI